MPSATNACDFDNTPTTICTTVSTTLTTTLTQVLREAALARSAALCIWWSGCSEIGSCCICKRPRIKVVQFMRWDSCAN